MLTKTKFVIIAIFLQLYSYSQSDIDKVLKGGEIIVNGLLFFKNNKSETKETNSKVIESVCIKKNLLTK